MRTSVELDNRVAEALRTYLAAEGLTWREQSRVINGFVRDALVGKGYPLGDADAKKHDIPREVPHEAPPEAAKKVKKDFGNDLESRAKLKEMLKDPNLSKSEIARRLDYPYSTVSMWIKRHPEEFYDS